MGHRARPDWTGRLVRLALEPLSWLIGCCVAEQPWQRVHPEVGGGVRQT